MLGCSFLWPRSFAKRNQGFHSRIEILKTFAVNCIAYTVLYICSTYTVHVVTDSDRYEIITINDYQGVLLDINIDISIHEYDIKLTCCQLIVSEHNHLYHNKILYCGLPSVSQAIWASVSISVCLSHFVSDWVGQISVSLKWIWITGSHFRWSLALISNHISRVRFDILSVNLLRFPVLGLSQYYVISTW